SALPPPGGYTSWQAALDGSGGSSAGIGSTTDTNTSSLNEVTLFGVAAAGQLGHTNVGSIAGGSIASDSLAGGSIAGGSVAGGAIPAREVSLRAIVLNSQLRSVLVSDIRTSSDIVDCSTFNCTPAGAKTLGDAANASPNAIRSSATFGLLMDELPPSNPARQMTLSELVMVFLPLSNYPWELLNVQGLQDVSGTGQNVDYHVDFDLACAVTNSFTVTTRLPSGEFPVAGSTSFSYGGRTGVAGTDPSLDSVTGFTWTAVLGSPCAGGTATRHVRLNFSAYERLQLGEHTA